MHLGEFNIDMTGIDRQKLYYKPGDPKIKISRESAQKSIEESFSDLQIQSIEWFADGGANTAYLVNREYVFRFAKDTAADCILEMEIVMLSIIQKAVNISIPEFEYLGRREGLRFVGYRLIPGERLTVELLNKGNSSFIKQQAEIIAEFIKQLHDVDSAKAEQGGVPQISNKDFYARQFSDVKLIIYPFLEKGCSPKDVKILISYIEQLFENYFLTDAYFDYVPVLCHGSLYHKHIIYDSAKGKVSGIVDFGGLHMDDPDSELHQLYSYYGKPFIEAMFSFLSVKNLELLFGKLEFYWRAQFLRRLLKAVLVGTNEKRGQLLEKLKSFAAQC